VPPHRPAARGRASPPAPLPTRQVDRHHARAARPDRQGDEAGAARAGAARRDGRSVRGVPARDGSGARHPDDGPRGGAGPRLRGGAGARRFSPRPRPAWPGRARRVTAAAVAAVPYRAPVNKWIVTLSVTFGTLMGAIDTSIVAVATPHLSGSLGSTIEEMTWVTTGFVIATVVVMPLTAFLGRFFGQKRVYLAALCLFVLGSALCGLARSLPAMVA